MTGGLGLPQTYLNPLTRSIAPLQADFAAPSGTHLNQTPLIRRQLCGSFPLLCFGQTMMLQSHEPAHRNPDDRSNLAKPSAAYRSQLRPPPSVLRSSSTTLAS